RDLGGDVLATGHYVQRAMGPAGPELRRAVDPARDQSYFLFATTPDQLDYLRFPLGGMEKPAVRAHALRFGLEVADKPDSQDICFVPTGRYGEVVQKLRPGAVEPGEIVDLDGAVLGRHEGVIHYTIGQRKGLGIGGRVDSTDALYVVRIDPDRHRVVVGPKAALAKPGVLLGEVNWLGDALPEDGLAVQVKLRSAMAPIPARVHAEAAGLRVVFETPEFGVSPGQACVFYEGERVLGGGCIQREAQILAA
ncbi:MAG: tRNA 2-thiouridine(34) synthase MnmA, partial [Alphaproteobacteria bacterium]|nr:tRNA 2-thiouridine(34) synthase MnmA [Alphaproteobacteria bacterium]